MKSLNSIQTKLVFTYLVLIFFSTSITYMFFVPRIQSYLLERAENHLRRESQVIANIITNTYTFADANLALVAEDIRKNFSSVQGMRVRVYDPEGTLVADSATKIPHRRVIGDDARQGLLGKQVTWVETDDGHRTLHVSNPLKAPGRVFGVVDLAVQIGDQETIAEIRNTMMWALAISILASWIVGFLLARTIVDPISRIRSAAHRIAEGDLAHRVPTGGKDELSDLGHAINHMAAQLESRIGEIVSEKNKMNSLLETLIDGVVALDSENRVSFLNHVAEKLLNIKSDEVIGEPLTAVFDYPPLKSLLAECVEKEALLSREIVRAQDVSLLLASLTARERLAVFLVSLSRRFADRGFDRAVLRLPMSRPDIASHLGLTPETVSRALSAFEKQQIIDVQARTVTIRDPDRLERAAGIAADGTGALSI